MYGPPRLPNRPRLPKLTLHDFGGDLRAHPELRPPALDRHEVVRLHHGGDDRLLVHRANRPQVDHLVSKRSCESAE